MGYSFFFLDLWPYFLISIVFIVLKNGKSENNSRFIYLILLLFTIFRYDVGWDYTAYADEIKLGINHLQDTRYEPFSKAIFILSASMNFYPLTFIIFGWITLHCIYKSINGKSNNYIISWLVYFSLPLFFFASLSTIRQSIATVIILYSYKYLKDNKYLKFFILIAIGTLFHSSALLGIFLLFIYKFPASRKFNIIIFIVSFIFPVLLNEIIINWISNIIPSLSLFSKYIWYIDNTSEGTTKLQYLYYFFGVFNLVFYNRLIKINPENQKYIKIVNIGIVIFNILTFSPVAAIRISAFFLIFLIYIIPDYSLLNYKYQYFYKRIIVYTLLAISFYYLWIYIDAFQNGISTKISFLPYKTWLNNIL